MKYFFRDKDSAPNLENGMDFHAAGIIVGDIVPTIIATPSGSGKDVIVLFLHPFTGFVEQAWRAFDDIEMYQCDDGCKIIDYDYMVELLEKLEEQEDDD